MEKELKAVAITAQKKAVECIYEEVPFVRVLNYIGECAEQGKFEAYVEVCKADTYAKALTVMGFMVVMLERGLIPDDEVYCKASDSGTFLLIKWDTLV